MIKIRGMLAEPLESKSITSKRAEGMGKVLIWLNEAYIKNPGLRRGGIKLKH